MHVRADAVPVQQVSLREALIATVPADTPNPVHDRLDKVLAERAASASSPAVSASKPRSAPVTVLAIGGGIAVLLVAGVAVTILAARQRRRPTAAGEAGWPAGTPRQGPA